MGSHSASQLILPDLGGMELVSPQNSPWPTSHTLDSLSPDAAASESNHSQVSARKASSSEYNESYGDSDQDDPATAIVPWVPGLEVPSEWIACRSLKERPASIGRRPTVQEQIKAMEMLLQENSSLKLRLFCLEEGMREQYLAEGHDYDTEVKQLHAKIASMKAELAECHQRLDKRGMALARAQVTFHSLQEQRGMAQSSSDTTVDDVKSRSWVPQQLPSIGSWVPARKLQQDHMEKEALREELMAVKEKLKQEEDDNQDEREISTLRNELQQHNKMKKEQDVARIQQELDAKGAKLVVEQLEARAEAAWILNERLQAQIEMQQQELGSMRDAIQKQQSEFAAEKEKMAAQAVWNERRMMHLQGQVAAHAVRSATPEVKRWDQSREAVADLLRTNQILEQVRQAIRKDTLTAYTAQLSS